MFDKGMEVHGASFFQQGFILNEYSEFPENPPMGAVVLKDGVIWTYSQIEGILSWNPLTGQEKAAHLHIQGVAAENWVVNHNQKTEDFIAVVYSEDGSVITPADYEVVDNSQLILKFNSPVKGRALIFFATAIINPVIGSNYITVQTKLTVEGETELQGQVDFGQSLQGIKFSGEAVTKATIGYPYGETFVPSLYDILEGNSFTDANDNLAFAGKLGRDELTSLKSSIIPESDEVYDLGASDKKFRDLYLSGNTIHLGDLKVKDTGTGQLAIVAQDEEGADLPEVGLITAEDFKSVDIKNLSINESNEFVITFEDDSTETLDMTQFLDEDSAVVKSVAYDAENKNLVFTRADATEFTLDASVFFDDTNLVTSVAGKTGAVTLVEADISDFGNYEPADASILKNADIGVNVQAYDANIVSDANYVHTDNNFEDALKAKLNVIEEGATADQTKTDIDALGIDSATVNGKTVESNVPANAKFTDTVYVKPTSEPIGYISGLQSALDKKEEADPTILKESNIGVDVQAYDANIVSDSNYTAQSITYFDLNPL